MTCGSFRSSCGSDFKPVVEGYAVKGLGFVFLVIGFTHSMVRINIYKFNDLLDWKIINNIFMLNPFPLLSLTFMVNALGLLVNGGYDKPP